MSSTAAAPDVASDDAPRLDLIASTAIAYRSTSALSRLVLSHAVIASYAISWHARV